MSTVTDEFQLMKDRLAKDIASEIVLAENPEAVIKKWRNIFKIPQKNLANELGTTPSVISDYESGRRKSPGIRVIKRYVNTLLDIDTKNGGQVIRTFAKPTQNHELSNAILDLKEFSKGMKVSEFCRKLNVHMVTKNLGVNQEIYGYTMIDSLKAITEFSFSELIKLYGLTTQRILIFTKVSTGKTPMVAIKLTNIRPAAVILHGLTSVDDVAKRIAEVENIPLGVCRLETINQIKEQLAHIKN